MEQQFKYIYQGKEVSKEEFTNVAKEMFKWFDNNTINAVDYSSVSDFLGENYKSKGEINKHLKGVLDGFYTESKGAFIEDPMKWDYKSYPKENNILNEFKKAVDNSVSDGDFSKKSLDKELEQVFNILKSKCEDRKDNIKKRFAEAGAKAGEKYTHPFLQSFDNLKGGESIEAYKETEGKLFYELDWSFITQMAERMASNKKESKYNLWNWKKPMTPKGIEDLKQATLRHLLAVLDGVYEDDNREFGHIEAISDNMMMINYQLKNNLK